MFNVDLPAVPPSPLNLPKGPLALGQVEAIRQGAHFKGTGRLWKMSEKCVSAIRLFPHSPASSPPAPESRGASYSNCCHQQKSMARPAERWEPGMLRGSALPAFNSDPACKTDSSNSLFPTSSDAWAPKYFPSSGAEPCTAHFSLPTASSPLSTSHCKFSVVAQGFGHRTTDQNKAFLCPGRPCVVPRLTTQGIGANQPSLLPVPSLPGPGLFPIPGCEMWLNFGRI